MSNPEIIAKVLTPEPIDLPDVSHLSEEKQIPFLWAKLFVRLVQIVLRSLPGTLWGTGMFLIGLAAVITALK